jgi:hypothetical protein
MDVLGRPSILTVSLRRAKLVSMLVVAGWIAGCSGSAPPKTIPSPPEPFNELKQKIAALRELPFKREVSFVNEPPGTLEASPAKFFTEPYLGQSIVDISRTYKRLGLFPESTDFAKALADYSRLERIFYYEASRATIVMTPDSAELARTVSGIPNPDLEQISTVLALAQALQEQNFQWQGRLKRVSLEDRKLVFGALAAGDASLVGVHYLRRLQPTIPPPSSDPSLAAWVAALEKMASDLPPLLRQKLIFPYREGSQFVRWAHAARGWPGVNGLFVDPPLSTAQILHPEKYYLKRQNPQRISFPGLAQQMKERAVVDQTLGEYLVQLLVLSRLSRQEATQLAASWSGDQLSVYQEGEHTLTVWITAWQSNQDAQGFFRIYQSVLEQSHRLRFQAHDGGDSGVHAELAGGRSMLLQIKGKFVLLLDGAAATRVGPLSDAVWRDLDVDTESTVLFFESAKAAAQLSFSSK